MSLADVRNFINDETPRLLWPAFDKAVANAAVQAPDSLQAHMWQGWTDYFEELMAQNATMCTWRKERIATVLEQEVIALQAVEDIIKEALKPDADPMLDDDAKPLVQALLDVMKIERMASQIMLAEVGDPP